MAGQSKETQALQVKLFDEDEEIVIDAIEKLKDKGDALSIDPLLELLLSGPSPEVEKSLLSLFYGLKDKKAINVFFEKLPQQKYAPICAVLLSVVWNANFDANNHISTIINLGLKREYNALFEALTIVENLEGPHNEEQLLESIAGCKHFLNENPAHEKKALVEEILANLLRLDNQSSDAF